MIKAITGTKDILPEEINRWRYLENIVLGVMDKFNYKEIRTPVFEETPLFARGIGEATDIVSKEMYTFTDRSGTSVTLKPEMTASVVRAYIEHNMAKKQNMSKMFYVSPMFRQERPQAGRFRQFHQFGAEALGSHSPALDAEMIIVSYDILTKLGIKNLNVVINSLGIPEERENYKNILREYLASSKEKLSEESKKRYDTNILRLFDSKDEGDQQIMENAPLLLEYLGEESLEHFEQVKQILLKAGVPFTIDPKLVRGLDYYTHTTFEITSGSVGSQSALCGGGRYNLLIEQLGGAPAPGVGFAAGMERILLACENEGCLPEETPATELYITRIEKDKETDVYNIATEFRRHGIATETDYLQRSVKAQMREANRLNAKFVLIVGGDEFLNGEFVLKNMGTGEQETFPMDKPELVINRIRG